MARSMMDIANAVAFLASAKAQYITGSTADRRRRRERPDCAVPYALQVLCRNPKEIAMSIRKHACWAAQHLALASPQAAHADGLRPIDAKSIRTRRGGVRVLPTTPSKRDGFHVVTTLAQGMAGKRRSRVVSVLAPGQSVAFSTPHQAGALGIRPERRQRVRPQGEIGLELNFGPIWRFLIPSGEGEMDRQAIDVHGRIAFRTTRTSRCPEDLRSRAPMAEGPVLATDGRNAGRLRNLSAFVGVDLVTGAR